MSEGVEWSRRDRGDAVSPGGAPADDWVAEQAPERWTPWRVEGGRWGMSEAIGPVSVLPHPDQEQPLGVNDHGPAPATRELNDQEVRRLLEECYVQARKTLEDHRENLDRLAHALLERETLESDEAYEAAGIPRSTPSDAAVPADRM